MLRWPTNRSRQHRVELHGWSQLARLSTLEFTLRRTLSSAGYGQDPGAAFRDTRAGEIGVRTLEPIRPTGPMILKSRL